MAHPLLNPSSPMGVRCHFPHAGCLLAEVDEETVDENMA